MLTALTWRALCAMRCAQLGIATDSDETTACSRACNFRARLDPPLPPSYCGNAVDDVVTEMSVRRLLGGRVADIARELRASLRTQLTPRELAARAAWLRDAHEGGCTTRRAFDANALKFVVSSWNFDWEAAAFHSGGGGGGGGGGGVPVAFDHGALVPIVAVFTRRPKGDGLNVYASGPRETLEGVFVRALDAARAEAAAKNAASPGEAARGVRRCCACQK